MSWAALIDCLERRLGPKVAALVDEAVREEFGGDRLYIPSRKPITRILKVRRSLIR